MAIPHRRLCKDCLTRYAQDGLDRCNRCFNARTRTAPSPFMRANLIEALAAKAKPKPLKDSWWTLHAQPNTDRAAFVAEVAKRAMVREQKSASSAGIAIHRMGPA